MMINAIRHLLSPKAAVRVNLRGKISARDGLTIHAIILHFKLNGYMRVIAEHYVLIDLEGPKSKIEAVIDHLSQAGIGRGHILTEVGWGEYEKRYEHFRCSIL